MQQRCAVIFRCNRSYSLIELIVVVAIIGLLAALAVPTYKTYTLRAEVAKSIGYAMPYINRIKAYYGKNGVFPSLPNQVLDTVQTQWTSDNGTGGMYNVADEPYIESISYVGYYFNNPQPLERANVAVHFRSNLGIELVPGNSAFITFTVYPDEAGNLLVACGNWYSGFDFQKIKPELMPANCTALDLYSAVP